MIFYLTISPDENVVFILNDNDSSSMSNFYRRQAEEDEKKDNDYTFIIINDGGNNEDIDITHDSIHWFHLAGAEMLKGFSFIPLLKQD